MTFSLLGTDTETNEQIKLFKASRPQGLYCIGAPGTGKSGLFENLIINDIKQEIGICVLDPHGTLIQKVLQRIPDKKREKKIILFDIENEEYVLGLNLLTCPDPTNNVKVQKTLSQVLHVFEKAYGINPNTPQMYDYLYNSAYTLIVNAGCTIIDIRQLLTDEGCRKKLLRNVKNDDVLSFWRDYEMPENKQRILQERRAILNKLIDFSHAPLRAIVGQSKTTLNLKEIMDEGKILLVKLTPLLENATSLLGSVIVAQILNAAYARKEEKRRQFHLYVDEFHRFATKDFATLIEEARKFGIACNLAHQSLVQVDRENKAAALTAVNLVVFRVSGEDAHELKGQFDATPPPAELRREELLEPARDVITRLVNVGHPNSTVDEFVRDILIPIYEASNDKVRIKGEAPVQFGWTEKKEMLDICNNFFYEVMIEHNPQKVMPPELFHIIAKVASKKYRFPSLFEELEKNLVSFEGYSTSHGKYRERWLQSEIKQVLDRVWVNPLVYESKTRFAEIPDFFELLGLLYTAMPGDPSITVRPSPQATQELQSFTRFFVSVAITMRELAINSITAGSGMYEMKPVGQMTYADVANRIANQLSSLPDHMAKIRVRNIIDNTIVEHVIKTFPPERGLSEADLQDRIEYIQAINRSDGYIRRREDVEEEIKIRQQQCGNPPQEPQRPITRRQPL